MLGTTLGQFPFQSFALGPNSCIVVQLERRPELIFPATAAALDVCLVDVLAPHLWIGLHVLADGKKSHAGNILVHGATVNPGLDELPAGDEGVTA